jgi:hypothetical protein
MSGFDPRELLGKAESDRLEFKDADALRRPTNIAREVVGFLNAQGGDVWIGVKEASGKATDLQTIPNVEAVRRSLLDSLIDLVEPRFSPREVDVSCVGDLLRVSVLCKGQNPPYALRHGGRHFLVRIADRLVEMSREEIARAFKARATEKASAKHVFEQLREAQRGEALTRNQLWLRMLTTEPLKIDFDDEPTKDRFRTWLTEPTATGNRGSGWDFATSLWQTRFLGDHVEHGNDTDYLRTSITERGQLSFAVDLHALSRLEMPTPRFEPYALIEYPVSVFRLMATILRTHDPGQADLRVVVGLVMKGIRGWVLTPGSPREPVRVSGKPEPFPDDVLEIDPEKLEFDANKLKESPDQCALRLVRLIYARFGFESDAIPREFDQKQGVLLLG